MKSIGILGITGSIGTSTIQVMRSHPGLVRIELATSHNNSKKLLRLAEEFSIPHVVLTNQISPDSITDIPPGCTVHYGTDALDSLLKTLPLDVVFNAISGSAGMQSTLTSLEAGIDVALANKESLVMAGHLVKPLLAKTHTTLLPVDSEHSAILQAMSGRPVEEVHKLIITASGGPFRQLPLEDFSHIDLAQSLKHPTWDMGFKVTMDSATMLNKGLEIIEAHWLFDMPYSRIEAIIHPQSIIHSMVQFIDGSILAQMSKPTMQLPILYALTHPKHVAPQVTHTDFLAIKTLQFEAISTQRYPLFGLALQVAAAGGLLPTIMNAANEAAIELFRTRRIRFNDIFTLVAATVEQAANIPHPDVETILTTNHDTRNFVLKNFQTLI